MARRPFALPAHVIHVNFGTCGTLFCEWFDLRTEQAPPERVTMATGCSWWCSGAPANRSRPGPRTSQNCVIRASMQSGLNEIYGLSWTGEHSAAIRWPIDPIE